jgi:hypothetical protein
MVSVFQTTISRRRSRAGVLSDYRQRKVKLVTLVVSEYIAFIRVFISAILILYLYSVYAHVGPYQGITCRSYVGQGSDLISTYLIDIVLTDSLGLCVPMKSILCT